MSPSDWGNLYHTSVPLLALSYLVRTTLFLELRPQDAMEWATTVASATMLLFFGTLSYWIHRGTYGGGPVIYPPLVIAATISMVASVIFTVVAVRAWTDRRRDQ